MLKRIFGLVAVVGLMATAACGNGGSGGDGGGSSQSTGSSSSAKYDCCINDVHFSCPNQSSFDMCANFESPDPSACNQVASACGSLSSGSSNPSTGSSNPSTGSSNPSTGSGSSSDLGNQCQSNSDCQFNSCLVADGADFGYCTKTCMDFTECPDFWSCDNVGNATGKYCIQN